ncbi:hypothetical protein H0X48_05090 [Candidatus Dependentiae bacterium]|nr:hypothetical protein [Candidatus Dependentiae bacterium]
MPIKNIVQTLAKKLKCTPRDILTFLQLQLFLTLISWPILLCWGLPLSLASPVGNFIFTPFLIIFLSLASLVFFSELLYIPNGFLVYLLEQVADWWYTILTYCDRSWLFYSPQPSLGTALLIPALAFLILHTKKLSRPLISTIIFALSIIGIAGYLRYDFNPTGTISIVGHPEKQLTLIHYPQATVLIDPGYLGKTISATNWVTYTLIPELTKKSVQTIDYLIVLKPSSLVFQALTTLCNKFLVKHIYLVSWSGQLNNTGWRAWEQLLAVQQRLSLKITSIDKEPLTLTFSPQDSLTLTPTGTVIKKNKLRYPRVTITGALSGIAIEPVSSLT